MKKIFLAAAFLIAASGTVQAEQLIYEGGYNPDLSFQQYVEQAYPKFQRSIIYVFTGNSQCYGCPQTISLLQRYYNELYTNIYDFQVINYQQDQEYNYTQAYNLSEPLEIVLVKIEDGEQTGYKKLHNLRFQYDDPISFKETFENDVNSYLGQ